MGPLGIILFWQIMQVFMYVVICGFCTNIFRIGGMMDMG